MSALSEIRELEGRHILLGILGFLGVVAPGFLTIYHFHPELIEKYDVIKLSIFSGALTLPAVFLNLLILVITHPKKDGPDHTEGLTLATLGAAIQLYFGLMAAYLLHLSFREMAIIIAIILLSFFLLMLRAERKGIQQTESDR